MSLMNDQSMQGYLYSIDIKRSGKSRRYQEWIVESGPLVQLFKTGRPSLPSALERWAQERAHEASVQWGFVVVEVSVCRYFPARIGMDKDNGSCVRSVLEEWTYQCEKVKS